MTESQPEAAPELRTGIDEDVEGHFFRAVDTEAAEDDVEGHHMSGEVHPDIYGETGRTP